MKFACPNCKKSYTLNADLLLDKEQKIRCAKCSHQWVEVFSDNPLEDTSSVLDRISKINKQPMSESQILKVLREEAEFDKNIQKSSAFGRNQFKYKKGSKDIENLGQDAGLTFLEIIYDKEFRLGFCLSVLLILILLVLYVYSDWISNTVPYLSDYLLKYANILDLIRIKIDMIKNELIALVRDFLNY